MKLTGFFTRAHKLFMEAETISTSVANRTTESIPERFAKIAARFPERIAISDASGQSCTYAELDARSSAIAVRILERVDHGSEPVAILMSHGTLLIAAILAVLKAGKIYIALDPNDPAPRLKAMLNDAGARILLTDETHHALAQSLEISPIAILEIPENVFSSSVQSLPTVAPEAGAWLMYTSGSTGTPKGVWQNHRGVIHHAEVYCELVQITPADRLSLLTSCSLAASATAIFSALLSGATLCPFHLRSQGVERLGVWLREEKITVLHCVPTVFRHLARTQKTRDGFESVRLIRLGGEPVLRGDVEMFRELCSPNALLMHAFSSTETGLVSALMIDLDTALPDLRVPAGRAVRDVEILISNSDGQPVRIGEEGVISIRSANLSQGYWRQPDATASAFQQVDAASPIRIFRTADRGRFRSDGLLEHLGRGDQQVKIRGRRVDLSEVESALRATDFFEEAAAAAPEDASGERRLVAYVVPRSEKNVTSQTYRRALLPTLPEHMLPSDFIVLQKLPQTPSGKIDRVALPSPPVARHGDLSDEAKPRMVMEKSLARIWEMVLGVAPIGRTDDFFELGGTSLLSVEILSRIEERFGVTLPPSTLVEHGTIEQLAHLLGSKVVRASSSPLIQLRASETGRPLFLVHSGRGDVAAYGQLALRLPGRPIYGFQSVGLNGKGIPRISVPAMARRYLKEVLAKDPTGPYLLGGSCLGAMVAFEMAMQLTRRGKSVAFLALFDFAPKPAKKKTISRRIKSEVHRMRDALRVARWLIGRTLSRKANSRQLKTQEFISKLNRESTSRYRPGFFPGTLTVVVSRDMRFPLGDRRLTMTQHARDARVITVPGERAGIFMSPAVDELAGHLREILNAIDECKTPAHQTETAAARV